MLQRRSYTSSGHGHGLPKSIIIYHSRELSRVADVGGRFTLKMTVSDTCLVLVQPVDADSCV
jgi:hypothetical protein